MDWLYDLGQPFVWHAWRAFGVAFAFLLLYGFARLVRPYRPRSSPKPILVATLGAVALWLVSLLRLSGEPLP
jgi:hypothetical protein